MSESDGPGITLPDAYSRVTNPRRFAPLQIVAAELLDQLSTRFDVARAEGYHLDPELEASLELARPGVKLTPRDASSAPLVVVFSAFPGLHARFGRWCLNAFPVCGCDACEETAEGEVERLNSMIGDLTSGRFREAIQTDAAGDKWLESAFGSQGESVWRSSRSRLDAEGAQKLLAEGGPSSYVWKAWAARS